MRQGDGSDLLGPGNPRNSDIGILYVESRDSRQDILTAISTQELQGRKQIALVLPEQGKAFRQPVDFDGLKNMRRQLKAQLVFIAPPGPGPAEFARQRRFPVYSSLDSFKNALLNEGIPSTNPRVKAIPGATKKPGLFARKARSGSQQGASQEPSPIPPTPRLPNQQPLSPIPPTPRLFNQPGSQAVPPTPHFPDQSAPQGAASTPRFPDQQVPPTPRIEDRKTIEVDQSGKDKAGTAGAAAGAAAGMLAANALEGDDDALYAPPAPPTTPGQVAPIAQGSVTPTGPAVGPARSGSEPPAKPPLENRAAPDIIVFPGVMPTTPRATGKMNAAQGTSGRASGKLSPKGRGSGKLPANPANAAPPAALNANAPLSAPAQGSGAPPDPNMPGPQNAPGAGAQGQPGWKVGSTGKMAAVGAGAALGAGVVAGVATRGAATAAGPGAPSAVAGGTGGPGIGARPSGLTPLPPPYSRRNRRRFWRRTVLLLVLLVLLSGALVFGIFAARGGIPGLPGNLNATVTITPASVLEQDNYLIEALLTGTPDPAQRQISARMLTQTSDTKTGTGNATGSIPAKQASGPLKFQNVTGSSLTIASTTLHGKSGVPVSFNGPVTVPATGTIVVTGFAVNAGASGNIAAFDISGSCCFSGIFVNNTGPFTGGQDAQPNSIIQQSDIDNAAKPLITSLSQDTQNKLQMQVKSNERVVDGSFNCKPTVNPSVKAGTKAKSVTVTVQVACTEEVYDFAAAQSMATSLLQQKAQSDPNLNAQFALDGKIVTNVLSDSLVSVADGKQQVNIEMQAQGLWVYQFTEQMQQNIKNSLVKHTKADALSILEHDVGVAKAQISISSGNMMPANANDITLTIQTLPGAQQGTPTGSPAATPTSLPTQPATSPTPINGLGGS